MRPAAACARFALTLPRLARPRSATLAATARPALQQAADAGAAAGKTKYNVDGSNFEIAPSTIPWKNYKNEYFEKRGYKVAPKDWKVRGRAGGRGAPGGG